MISKPTITNLTPANCCPSGLSNKNLEIESVPAIITQNITAPKAGPPKLPTPPSY